MPMDFMKTIDQLNDCFTDRQVSDVFNCEGSKSANQLILKYLTANLNGAKGLSELCTYLEMISTSENFDNIITDLRSSCKSIKCLSECVLINL